MMFVSDLDQLPVTVEHENFEDLARVPQTPVKSLRANASTLASRSFSGSLASAFSAIAANLAAASSSESFLFFAIACTP